MWHRGADATCTAEVSKSGTQNCDGRCKLQFRRLFADFAVSRFGTSTAGTGISRRFQVRSCVLASGHGGRQPVLFDLPVERAAADVEHAGGLLLVPADALEHAQEWRSFGVPQRRNAGRLDAAAASAPACRNSMSLARMPPGRGERRARDGAFELADVARPGIADEPIDRVRPKTLPSSGEAVAWRSSAPGSAARAPGCRPGVRAATADGSKTR